MPPPKLPLTTVSEPDPIYPYLPFLFYPAFGNGCATALSSIVSTDRPRLFRQMDAILSPECASDAGVSPEFRTRFVHSKCISGL